MPTTGHGLFVARALFVGVFWKTEKAIRKADGTKIHCMGEGVVKEVLDKFQPFSLKLKG